MQHALPTHAHPARAITRRLAWPTLGLGFGLQTPAGFQHG
jgi:hypothetical protein